jgi:hypothetical protein
MLLQNATAQQIIDELNKLEDKNCKVWIREAWSGGEWTNDIDITVLTDGDVEIE